MSDLISRLSVKDRASEYAFSADEYERFCEIIDSEPTAYDLDKVVEHLESKKRVINNWRDRYTNRIIDECIKIVKGCGKNDRD